MRFLSACIGAALLFPGAGIPSAIGAEKERPLLRDFLGLCVHTIQFKPHLYSPVTRVVRDYHPLNWDVGEDTSFETTLPMARNKVDWNRVYGPWKALGYKSSASIMFDDIEAARWKDLPGDARKYGKAFAGYFGPGRQGLLEAAEIGNEPGKYSDEQYRTLFESMARGLREGDPKLKIATCAANLGPSGRYSKSVDILKGLEELYDIVNVHIYPEVEGWPTWRRSYPEDPKINFLRDLGHVLEWRKLNVPDKEVWLTEWGYDASSKPAPPTGTFAKWVGNTEEEQALWIVRGFLVLAATELERAYLYFFNDPDEAHVHGSSGLTRNYVPKPAFHAVAHLQRALGEYRLDRVHIASAADGYAQEWVHGANAKRRVTVLWRPEGGEKGLTAPIGNGRILHAEKLALAASEPETAGGLEVKNSEVNIRVGVRPVFIYWEQP